LIGEELGNDDLGSLAVLIEDATRPVILVIGRAKLMVSGIGVGVAAVPLRDLKMFVKMQSQFYLI
jgi:hypothetical protein